MSTACIIGLPRELRTRFITQTGLYDLDATLVIAERTKSGEYIIVPDPSHAAAAVHAYQNSHDDYSQVRIFALPYAPLPFELRKELIEIKDIQGQKSDGMNEVSWPKYTAFAEHGDFLDALYQKLCELFFPQESLLSEKIKAIARSAKNLKLFDNAFETCDGIPKHRFDFAIKATFALRDLVRHNKSEGTLANYFKSRGVKYAATGGGIKYNLTVLKEDKKIHQDEKEDHLKEGDATTPAAATRYYFQAFRIENSFHAAVFYIGIHRDERNKEVIYYRTLKL